jgi:hypothetical protein
MTPARVIALNPTGLKDALEARLAELSDLLHRLTTEKAILREELQFLRAGSKSAMEVKAALVARGVGLRET